MQDARVINSRACYLSPSRGESLFPWVRDLIGREQTDNGGHEEKEVIIPTRARSETRDSYRGKGFRALSITFKRIIAILIIISQKN